MGRHGQRDLGSWSRNSADGLIFLILVSLPILVPILIILVAACLIWAIAYCCIHGYRQARASIRNAEREQEIWARGRYLEHARACGISKALEKAGRERAMAALSGQDATEREGAALALRAWPEPASVEALLRATFDESLPVRIAAIQSLGAVGAPAHTALSLLRSRAQNGSEREVRAAAQEAVACIESAIDVAPAELLAAEPPAGRGTELQSSGPSAPLRSVGSGQA